MSRAGLEIAAPSYLSQPGQGPSHPAPTAGRSAGPSRLQSSPTEGAGVTRWASHLLHSPGQRVPVPASNTWPVTTWTPVVIGRSEDTLARGCGESKGIWPGGVCWHPQPPERQGRNLTAEETLRQAVLTEGGAALPRARSPYSTQQIPKCENVSR